MPIQVQAPDGSIAQFPDGMADADIEKVMAQHYPQPSTLDQAVASPIGRFVHDVGVKGLEGAANVATMLPLLNSAKPGVDDITNAVEGAYQGSLARSRNTPGYAAARQNADKVMAQRGSGLRDQMLAPFLPTIAGAAGLQGGLDSSNAMADAQQTAQDTYAKAHPVLSTVAGLAGGLASGAPEGVAQRVPIYAGDNPLVTRAINPNAMGPFQMQPGDLGAPSVSDLKGAARDAYRQVDNAGIQVAPDALNRLGDSAVDKFGERLDPTLHPEATAALNRVAQFSTDGAKGDQAATFSELDNLRKVVSDATEAPKKADRTLARQILDHVDDFVNGLSANDLDTTLQDQLRANVQQATSAKGQIAKQIKSIEQNKPGALAARGAAGADTRNAYVDMVQNQLPQAETARQGALQDFNTETDLLNAGPQATIDALNNARMNWSRAAQADTIQKQINKAAIQATANYSQSGFENALRQRFKSLALNDTAMARLSPDVQQAVISVAQGSKSANLLRALGKYAPHGPVSTALGGGVGGTIGAMAGGLMGASEGGAVGALALPAIGEFARMGATAKTLAAANRARDIAALGRFPPTAIVPAPLQLPTLPTNGALPFGLFPALPRQSAVPAR